MKSLFLPFLPLLLTLFFSVTLFSPAIAQAADWPDEYTLLTPLPGVDKLASDDNLLGEYLTVIYQIGISLVLLISVVVLIVAGIQYMMTDSFTKKGAAKDTITAALVGILLAVSGYVIIFFIIGPGATDFSLSIEPVVPGEWAENTNWCEVRYTLESVVPSFLRPPNYVYCEKLPLSFKDHKNTRAILYDSHVQKMMRGTGNSPFPTSCYAHNAKYSIVEAIPGSCQLVLESPSNNNAPPACEVSISSHNTGAHGMELISANETVIFEFLVSRSGGEAVPEIMSWRLYGPMSPDPIDFGNAEQGYVFEQSEAGGYRLVASIDQDGGACRSESTKSILVSY